MTRDNANRILDMLRCDEADFSDAVITKALCATGDLDEHECATRDGVSRIVGDGRIGARTAPDGCR